mgnify:CR=1 FL=1
MFSFFFPTGASRTPMPEPVVEEEVGKRHITYQVKTSTSFCDRAFSNKYRSSSIIQSVFAELADGKEQGSYTS